MTLRPLTMSHSVGMFEMWSSGDVCRSSGKAHDIKGRLIHLPARSSTDSDKIIEFFASRSVEGLGFRWAMMDKQTDRFLGAIGFNNLRPRTEVAYHLAPAAWGHGFALEALEEALRWAVENGFPRVEAWIEPENARSRALVLRAGFHSSGATDEGAEEFVRQLE